MSLSLKSPIEPTDEEAAMTKRLGAALAAVFLGLVAAAMPYGCGDSNPPADRQMTADGSHADVTPMDAAHDAAGDAPHDMSPADVAAHDMTAADTAPADGTGGDTAHDGGAD
jgi:hypothetical protein